MRNPGGYAIIMDPDTGTHEQDTFTCFHCNSVTHVPAKADPASLGGLCGHCMKLICPKCVGKACTPFMEKLLRLEARIDSRRSYGF